MVGGKYVFPLKITKYVYVTESGAARMTANKGSPADDEIEVEVTLKIPRELFKRRSPRVEIELPGPPDDETSGIKIEVIPSDDW